MVWSQEDLLPAAAGSRDGSLEGDEGEAGIEDERAAKGRGIGEPDLGWHRATNNPSILLLFINQIVSLYQDNMKYATKKIETFSITRMKCITTMSHAALIAMLHKETLFSDVNNITKILVEHTMNSEYFQPTLFLLFYSLVWLFFIKLISCSKKDERNKQAQERTIEFLLDQNANNELKIAKLTRQMKKLQKEINEYA